MSARAPGDGPMRPAGDCRRILIVNLTRFGDLLQTSPTVAALKARHPEASITLVAERNFADVCDGIPGIDRVYRLELDRVGSLVLDGGASLLEAYRYVEGVLAELRAERFDLALNYSSSRMTAVFMGLLGIADVRGWSMTPDGLRVIRHPWSRLFATMCLHRRFANFNLVDYYRKVADGAVTTRRLCYDVAPEARERAGALLAAAGLGGDDRMVALQLGASRASRQWPPGAFAALARQLAGAGMKVALIGGGGERALAAAVGAEAGAAVLDLCGRTGVGELGAVLARAEALVTGDTGPMHMAVAVGTPVVGLFFGPASPFDTGPYAADNVVLHTSAPCAPCAHQVSCLDPVCRDEITPALVAVTVRLRLASDWPALAALARASQPLRFYRTGFDAGGLFDCEALGDPPAQPADVLRRAYRATFLSVLEGEPLPTLPPGGIDGAPFAALAGLAREGEVTAARLVARAAGPQPPIRELERLGRELDTLDRALVEHGQTHPDTEVLTQLFKFGKENLEGDDVVTLATETRVLYRTLALEADLMAHLLAGAGPWKEQASDGRLHQ